MKNRDNIRLLITGASGFIGTNAIDFAVKAGFTVANFDIRLPRNPLQLAYWKSVDIREGKDLAEGVAQFSPTHIWHLAAKTGMDIDDLQYFSANTDGVENLIACASKAPIWKGFCLLQACLYVAMRGGPAKWDWPISGEPALMGA